MTYQPPGQCSIALLKIDWTSTLASNDYFSFSIDVNNINNLSVSTTSISLPPGCYSVEASFGGNRTNGFVDDLFYQQELEGVLIGNIGAADCSNSSNEYMNVDQAVSSFEIRKTSTLKLKCTNCTSSAWTSSSDYSYLLIRQVK